jgi:hypothetical protein
MQTTFSLKTITYESSDTTMDLIFKLFSENVAIKENYYF